MIIKSFDSASDDVGGHVEASECQPPPLQPGYITRSHIRFISCTLNVSLFCYV